MKKSYEKQLEAEKLLQSAIATKRKTNCYGNNFNAVYFEYSKENDLLYMV
jgi:hypothetical protein